MASTWEERLIPQPLSDTAAITVRLWKEVLKEQDKRSYAAGVAETEAKYKALLIEVLVELEAYNQGRGKAERRLYDWLVQGEHDSVWSPLMTKALRQLEVRP